MNFLKLLFIMTISIFSFITEHYICQNKYFPMEYENDLIAAKAADLKNGLTVFQSVNTEELMLEQIFGY